MPRHLGMHAIASRLPLLVVALAASHCAIAADGADLVEVNADSEQGYDAPEAAVILDRGTGTLLVLPRGGATPAMLPTAELDGWLREQGIARREVVYLTRLTVSEHAAANLCDGHAVCTGSQASAQTQRFALRLSAQILRSLLPSIPEQSAILDVYAHHYFPDSASAAHFLVAEFRPTKAQLLKLTRRPIFTEAIPDPALTNRRLVQLKYAEPGRVIVPAADLDTSDVKLTENLAAVLEQYAPQTSRIEPVNIYAATRYSLASTSDDIAEFSDHWMAWFEDIPPPRTHQSPPIDLQPLLPPNPNPTRH